MQSLPPARSRASLSAAIGSAATRAEPTARALVRVVRAQRYRGRGAGPGGPASHTRVTWQDSASRSGSYSWVHSSRRRAGEVAEAKAQPLGVGGLFAGGQEERAEAGAARRRAAGRAAAAAAAAVAANAAAATAAAAVAASESAAFRVTVTGTLESSTGLRRGSRPRHPHPRFRGLEVTPSLSSLGSRVLDHGRTESDR